MSAEPSPAFDVFVSVHPSDDGWGAWIAAQLEAAGYTVRLQAWDAVPGSHRVHELQTSLVQTARTIAVLSPEALASAEQAAEWYPRSADDPTGTARRLIPVIVRTCRPQGLLAARVALDLSEVTDEDVARTRLLEALAPGPHPPANRVSYPNAAAVLYPGRLPDLFRTGRLRNRQFTGRGPLLHALHAALTDGTASALVQGMHGGGGVGKTQLANEYAYRYGYHYAGVWWINAETESGLQGDLAALAVAWGVATIETPVPEAVAQVLERLRREPSPWLLIYDNAVDPSTIADYLPRGGVCRVLVTSRHPHWQTLGTELRVGVWTPDEAREFLVQQTGRAEPAAADQLAEAMGYLPLGLAQAAGYITMVRDITLAGYFDLFRTQRRKLWKEEAAPYQSDQTIATTWALSLRRLSRPAIGFLRLCAFFAPETIPGDVFVPGEVPLPARLSTVLADRLKFNRVKQEISGYGLADVSLEGVTLHRLVQLVIRDQLPVKEQERWGQAAGNVLQRSFEHSKDPQDWPGLRARLPHAAHLADALEKLDRDTAGRLLNTAGLFQRTQGAYAAASVLLQRAVQLAAEADAPDHPTLATYFSNLALIEQDLGNLDEARRRMLQALAIEEKVYAPDHPTLAVSYSNLAMIEKNLGHLDEARRRMIQALAIDEKAYAPDHPALARDYSNLAMIEQDLGNLNEARRRMIQAITIDEQAYAPDHPTLAIRYSNLAMIEQDLGNLDEARRRMTQAIDILEKAYAPDHPNLAVGYSNLATIERDLGNLDEARRRMTQALTIDEQAYAPDHPTLAVSYNNLAAIEQALGNRDEARRRMIQALAIEEQAYAPDHPTLAIRYNNLASIERALGNDSIARGLWERALTIFEAKLPAGHPHIAVVRRWLDALPS